VLDEGLVTRTVIGLTEASAAFGFDSPNALDTFATKVGKSFMVSRTSFLVPLNSTSYSPNLTRSENGIFESPFSNTLDIINIIGLLKEFFTKV
jgi:hypothetical protein